MLLCSYPVQSTVLDASADSNMIKAVSDLKGLKMGIGENMNSYDTKQRKLSAMKKVQIGSYRMQRREKCTSECLPTWHKVNKY